MPKPVMLPRITRETLDSLIGKVPEAELYERFILEQPEMLPFAQRATHAIGHFPSPVYVAGMMCMYMALKAQLEKGE